MEQEEFETWYALPTLIRWDDLECVNISIPVNPIANSEGFLLVYKTLEEFEKQHTGKMPMLMKAKKVAV